MIKMTFNEIMLVSEFFELTRIGGEKVFVAPTTIFLIDFNTTPNGHTRIQFFDKSFIYVLETVTDFRKILSLSEDDKK